METIVTHHKATGIPLSGKFSSSVSCTPVVPPSWVLNRINSTQPFFFGGGGGAHLLAWGPLEGVACFQGEAGPYGGVLHTQKPANILVMGEGPERGRVKIGESLDVPVLIVYCPCEVLVPVLTQ